MTDLLPRNSDCRVRLRHRREVRGLLGGVADTSSCHVEHREVDVLERRDAIQTLEREVEQSRRLVRVSTSGGFFPFAPVRVAVSRLNAALLWMLLYVCTKPKSCRPTAARRVEVLHLVGVPGVAGDRRASSCCAAGCRSSPSPLPISQSHLPGSDAGVASVQLLMITPKMSLNDSFSAPASSR